MAHHPPAGNLCCVRTVLLAGGTGGAKLAHGLQQVLEPGELTVIVNVADDTEFHGLLVCPDLDTILYTLAGLADAEQGWGVAADTHTAMQMLERYGEETWFRIGDADLATHVYRARLMRDGASLTDATAAMATALGVPSRLLPATNDPVRTIVETDAGALDFQTYFVRRRQEDAVRGLRFEGAADARPSTLALGAIAEAEVLIIGPSNPLVSIGPILAIPGIQETLQSAGATKVGVSGIVAGQAIRGPADRMLATLGYEPTARGVAALYASLIDRFVIDRADADLAPAIEALGMAVSILPTVMRTADDRADLARSVLSLA
jgi:LPPG:FO 2-phospho-L-lactate transferase